MKLNLGLGRVLSYPPPEMVFTSNATDDTFEMTIRGDSGKTVKFDWGDGTETVYPLVGASNVPVSHLYSSYDDYTISVYGSGNMTTFSISNTQVESNIYFDLDIFIKLNNVTIFSCTCPNTISVNLSDLPSVLTYFYCAGSNTILGDLSNLPSGITAFYCYGTNTISNYSGGYVFQPNVSYFILVPTSGGLDVNEINQLLIDMAATMTSSGTITLTGTNATPGAAGLSAIVTLEATGYTVNTN